MTYREQPRPVSRPFFEPSFDAGHTRSATYVESAWQREAREGQEAWLDAKKRQEAEKEAQQKAVYLKQKKADFIKTANFVMKMIIQYDEGRLSYSDAISDEASKKIGEMHSFLIHLSNDFGGCKEVQALRRAVRSKESFSMLRKISLLSREIVSLKKVTLDDNLTKEALLWLIKKAPENNPMAFKLTIQDNSLTEEEATTILKRADCQVHVDNPGKDQGQDIVEMLLGVQQVCKFGLSLSHVNLQPQVLARYLKNNPDYRHVIFNANENSLLISKGEPKLHVYGDTQDKIETVNVLLSSMSGSFELRFDQGAFDSRFALAGKKMHLLEIRDQVISDESVKQLDDIPSEFLKTITLMKCRFIKNTQAKQAVIRLVTRQKSLEKLTMQGCELIDHQLKVVAEYLCAHEKYVNVNVKGNFSDRSLLNYIKLIGILKISKNKKHFSADFNIYCEKMVALKPSVDISVDIKGYDALVKELFLSLSRFVPLSDKKLFNSRMVLLKTALVSLVASKNTKKDILQDIFDKMIARKDVAPKVVYRLIEFGRDNGLKMTMAGSWLKAELAVFLETGLVRVIDDKEYRDSQAEPWFDIINQVFLDDAIKTAVLQSLFDSIFDGDSSDSPTYQKVFRAFLLTRYAELDIKKSFAWLNENKQLEIKSIKLSENMFQHYLGGTNFHKDIVYDAKSNVFDLSSRYEQAGSLLTLKNPSLICSENVEHVNRIIESMSVDFDLRIPHPSDLKKINMFPNNVRVINNRMRGLVINKMRFDKESEKFFSNVGSQQLRSIKCVNSLFHRRVGSDHPLIQLIVRQQALVTLKLSCRQFDESALIEIADFMLKSDSVVNLTLVGAQGKRTSLIRYLSYIQQFKQLQVQDLSQQSNLFKCFNKNLEVFELLSEKPLSDTPAHQALISGLFMQLIRRISYEKPDRCFVQLTSLRRLMSEMLESQQAQGLIIKSFFDRLLTVEKLNEPVLESAVVIARQYDLPENIDYQQVKKTIISRCINAHSQVIEHLIKDLGSNKDVVESINIARYDILARYTNILSQSEQIGADYDANLIARCHETFLLMLDKYLEQYSNIINTHSGMVDRVERGVLDMATVLLKAPSYLRCAQDKLVDIMRLKIQRALQPDVEKSQAEKMLVKNIKADSSLEAMSKTVALYLAKASQDARKWFRGPDHISKLVVAELTLVATELEKFTVMMPANKTLLAPNTSASNNPYAKASAPPLESPSPSPMGVIISGHSGSPLTAAASAAHSVKSPESLNLPDVPNHPVKSDDADDESSEEKDWVLVEAGF